MNERRPQPALFWFHVKPAPSPGSAHRVAHASPAVPVVAIGFTELVQYTARGSCRLKQMHLPRLPRQEVFHPIGHDVLVGRPPATTLQRHPVDPHLLQHMTCLPPGKERPSRLIQQLRATASVLGYVCRVLWNLPARRFTIGFT